MDFIYISSAVKMIFQLYVPGTHPKVRKSELKFQKEHPLDKINWKDSFKSLASAFEIEWVLLYNLFCKEQVSKLMKKLPPILFPYYNSLLKAVYFSYRFHFAVCL